MPDVLTDRACLLSREDGALACRFDIQNISSGTRVSWKGFWNRVFCSQGGFSLVEMVATVSLLSILLAMATGGLTYYLSIKSVEISAREIITEIRTAQATAVATGNTYRLAFDAVNNKYTVQRRSGADYIDVRGALSLEGGTKFEIAPDDFGGDGNLDFYARGSSEVGEIILVGSHGNPITITVDGETVHINES
ncbi:MAG: pilus assembly FimT family protein [Thermoleophilia bacterium]